VFWLFAIIVGPLLALVVAVLGHGWLSLLIWPSLTLVVTGAVYLTETSKHLSYLAALGIVIYAHADEGRA
jgi:hypothetical protein